MTIYTTMDSPTGELLLVGKPVSDGGVVLASVSMPGQRYAPTVREGWSAAPERFGEVVRQLTEYFEGWRTGFELDVARSGTEFQQRIWRALDAIPYGTTTTYGKLAARLGVPRDRVQALGAAVGANPVLVVRPCHRVVGADGTLRGYAGGVERKQWLLIHEGALQPVLV